MMIKVYIVFKEEDYSDRLLSVHATEEGAKKECQRLYKLLNTVRYDPFYWEEQEVQP